jgi:hypothetical protein
MKAVLDSESFGVFGYVTLGHLHGSQSVGRDTIRYCRTKTICRMRAAALSAVFMQANISRLTFLICCIKRRMDKVAVEKSISVIDGKLDKAEQDNKARTEQAKAQEDLETATGNLPELKTSFDEAEKRYTKVETLTVQIAA